MQELITLIDKASKVCGNDAALADRMGVKPQVISMLRGGRTITPETAAELADIAGEDAREAAITAILDRAKGTRREGVLREVLGKALAAGVAGMLVFSYSADSISATKTIANKATKIYIVECMRRIAQVLARGVRGSFLRSYVLTLLHTQTQTRTLTHTRARTWAILLSL